MSDDIVKRLLIQDEVGLFDLPDSFHVVDYGDAADEIMRLRERIERLEGALRFYAEPDKYTDCHGADVQIPDFYSELDFGETARVALNATR